MRAACLLVSALDASFGEALVVALCSSEFGGRPWGVPTAKGHKMLPSSQLCSASGPGTLPAVSKGLLYVMQNEFDRLGSRPARMICYDLRGE